MSKKARICVAAVAVIVVAAACSGNNVPPRTSSTPSSPDKVPVETSANGNEPPHSGAPKVGSPLPHSALDGDPCTDALTSDRVQQAIGISDAGERQEDPGLGPACSWGNAETGGGVSVGYNIETSQGLSLNYANTKSTATEWTETAIRGYPAVIYNTPSSGISEAFCDISIGLADDRSITINLTLGRNKRGKVKPCDVVPQIADLVVTSIEEKARS